jgi:hypothetical protein
MTNNFPLPLAQDLDLKGGFRVVANTTERDAIPLSFRTTGMFITTSVDNKVYCWLGGALNNWVEAPGGTGQTSYTTGDTLYASATNVLSKRTIGSAGQVLTVAGGVPTWATSSSLTGATTSDATALGISCASRPNLTSMGVNVGITLNSDSGVECTMIGDSAGREIYTAYRSVFIGKDSGRSAGNYESNNYSVFIGWNVGSNAAYHNQTPSGTVSIGANSGYQVPYRDSIYIGNGAGGGPSRKMPVTSGDPGSERGAGNIFIGAGTGSSVIGPFYNATLISDAIAIGRDAVVSNSNQCVIGSSGIKLNVGINNSNPTARLHLPAGETGANFAPLKLTAGTALSAIEDGAMEYHSSHLYFSIGSTRYQLDQQGGLIGSTISGKTILGYGSAIAAGAGGVCIGSNTNLTGDGLQSVVIGDNARADYQSIVIGYNANNSGGVVENLFAIGTYAGTAGLAGYSTLVGNYAGNNISTGGYSTIIGHYACQSATQTYTISLGYKARTTGNNSIVIGTLGSDNWLDGKGANTIMIGNTTQTDTYLQPDALRIGTTLAGDKYIYAQNADTNKPYIRYDDAANEWQLSNNGSVVNKIAANNYSSSWWNSGITPTATALDGYRVAISGLTVKPGEPIRIFDKSGLIYNPSGTSPNNILSIAITGITSAKLDHTGSIYFKPVLTGGTTCRFDIYSDERTNYVSSTLIGHTDTFDANTTATPTLTITADNTSGIGGTLVVNLTTTVWDTLNTRILFMKTAICTSYDGTYLIFAGQAVSTNASAILEVWIGDPRLVVSYPINIPGTYADATNASAFVTKLFRTPRWDMPPAILCQVVADHNVADTGVAQPTIRVILNGQATYDALSLSTATTRVSTVVSTSKMLNVVYGDAIDLSVVQGTNGNASDLSGSAIFVTTFNNTRQTLII